MAAPRHEVAAKEDAIGDAARLIADASKLSGSISANGQHWAKSGVEDQGQPARGGFGFGLRQAHASRSRTSSRHPRKLFTWLADFGNCLGIDRQSSPAPRAQGHQPCPAQPAGAACDERARCRKSIS
jgi:hypothetical protein